MKTPRTHSSSILKWHFPKLIWFFPIRKCSLNDHHTISKPISCLYFPLCYGELRCMVKRGKCPILPGVEIHQTGLSSGNRDEDRDHASKAGKKHQNRKAESWIFVFFCLMFRIWRNNLTNTATRLNNTSGRVRPSLGGNLQKIVTRNHPEKFVSNWIQANSNYVFL